MPIDLLSTSPLDLALGAGLADLFDAVAAIEPWTPRHDEVLDYVYTERTERALRPGTVPKDDPDALIDHLRRVSTLRGLAAVAGATTDYAARWEGYAVLLEARRANAAAPAPADVLKRAHVERLLRRVRRGGEAGVEQTVLRKELDLKEANLCRVLTFVESCDLVVRRPKDGRSNVVFLTERGEEILGGRSEAKADASAAPAWSSFFCPAGR